MTLLEPAEPTSARPLSLNYATPEQVRRSGSTLGVAMITLFVCVTSILVFALVVHEHLDVWAAAVAVVALAAMGVFCTFFLTRRS